MIFFTIQKSRTWLKCFCVILGVDLDQDRCTGHSPLSLYDFFFWGGGGCFCKIWLQNTHIILIVVNMQCLHYVFYSLSSLQHIGLMWRDIKTIPGPQEFYHAWTDCWNTWIRHCSWALSLWILGNVRKTPPVSPYTVLSKIDKRVNLTTVDL